MRGARIVAIRSFFKVRCSRSDESVANVSSQMRVLGRVLSAVRRSESICCTGRRSLRSAVKFAKCETCLLVSCPLPDLTQSTLGCSHKLHIGEVSRQYAMHRVPYTSQSADLDILEKRGASFARASSSAPDDLVGSSSPVPRHTSSAATVACANAPYHSHFSGQGYFGISAYGLILIGIFLLLILLCYASIHLLVTLCSTYF